MAETSFPYVNAYGSIGKLFEKIQEASVPTKFNRDFLSTMLGLKSSSHHALISFLKRLDFIGQDNVPSENYKEYRDATKSKRIMAAAIRKAYSDLFTSNEYANSLEKTELKEKIKTITGISEKGSTLDSMVNSFIELVKLADFQGENIPPKKAPDEPKQESAQKSNVTSRDFLDKLGISYTINLNLPATTDIEVFNAIFKSLKENLLSD
ncbi:MAG: DUF5343 domain-containing protein [Candidatus Daviesbacteria bacterium]|nr:DUF5343 domain-containing protein [Candidatus Daviesbacteria bacterium]